MTTQQDHSFESVCREYEVDPRDVLETIELGLKRGYTPAELLDENSPVRDRIRLILAQQSAPILDGDRTDQIAAFTHGIAPQAEVPKVTEFNVGRWCLSEDECIADGIDFGAYERGVADAAKAFGRNATPTAPTGAQVEPVAVQPCPHADDCNFEGLCTEGCQARAATQPPALSQGVTDEQRDTAYEAAMDAWEKAVPRYLRGFSEWCDRFDAARKAYDAVLAHPGAGHKEEYTYAIGDAGQAYMARFPNAHPLPALFRWQELWDAMSAAKAGHKESGK